MATSGRWRFGAFCLDAASGCLWRDDTLIPLQPKPFALLAYLVAHAGHVVTKETLLEEVGSDVVVSEGVLKDYINQIRKALGDAARTSQYIATVHRRGYRFIAPVTPVDSVPPASTGGQPRQPPVQTVQRAPVPDDLTHIIVGREAELAQLQRCRSMNEAEAFHHPGVMTPERMLRELAEVIEELTATRPLLLVLEDLHWSDGATIDWLAYMARRRGTARLLVLGTIRPLETMIHAHPVRRAMHDVLLHGHAIELALGYWSETSVAAYLERRLGDRRLPSILAPVLHQRTGGGPFFVVTMVDELVRQEVLRESTTGWQLVDRLDGVTEGVPESLRQLIEQQLEQLTPAEQTLLEATSVVGREFAATAVAAAVDQEVVSVEALYTLLARRGQFLRVSGMEEEHLPPTRDNASQTQHHPSYHAGQVQFQNDELFHALLFYNGSPRGL